MIAELLDRVLVLVVKTLAYVAASLTVSIWLLVILALFVNLFKLLK
jgi:hypothetical protein